MHKTTKEHIRNGAKFLRLPTALKVKQYLLLPLQQALDILEIMKDKRWHSATEIAERLEISPFTVGETLRQLRQGGYPLESGNDGWRRIDKKRIAP